MWGLLAFSEGALTSVLEPDKDIIQRQGKLSEEKT